MGLILLVLLLALVFGGLGFAAHALWVIAVVLLVVWALGFVLRGSTLTGGRSRWYRW